MKSLPRLINGRSNRGDRRRQHQGDPQGDVPPKRIEVMMTNCKQLTSTALTMGVLLALAFWDDRDAGIVLS